MPKLGEARLQSSRRAREAMHLCDLKAKLCGQPQWKVGCFLEFQEFISLCGLNVIHFKISIIHIEAQKSLLPLRDNRD